MSDATATPTPSSSGTDTPFVRPGEKKIFVYVGEMIPNQVLIKNVSQTEQANYIMQGLSSHDSFPEWSFYGILRAGEAVSHWVQWPSSKVLFTNQGLFQSSIEVGGDGIFPQSGV